MTRWAVVPALAGLGLVALALRWHFLGQDLYRDELSTYWLMTQHSLPDGLRILADRMEITPPLSFVASWVTTTLGNTPALLRLPALLAGLALIPVTYLLGQRTLGRRAGLLAATIATLSPFAIFYSGEARAYGLVTLFAAVAALTALVALDTGRRRWWVAHALGVAATAYTHYTAVYVLLVLWAWIVLTQPGARVRATLANAGAAVLFAPWALTGLRGDLDSPDAGLASTLTEFTPASVLRETTHWIVGWHDRSIPLRELPGTVAIVLLALAVVLALAGLRRGAVHPRDRLALIVALVLAAPVGQVLAGLVGPPAFTTNSLATSFPFLAVALAGLLLAARPAVRPYACGLALAAFAIAAVRMADGDLRRPVFSVAAATIDADAGPADVVLDGSGAFVATPGPLTPLDPSLDRPQRIVRLGVQQQRERQFYGPPAPAPEAIAAAVRLAGDEGRIFAVSPAAPKAGVDGFEAALRREGLPRDWRVQQRVTTRARLGDVVLLVLGRG